MKTVDLLRCAVAELRDRGFTQHDFADYSTGTSETCQVCTVGAINVAAGHRPDDWYIDDVGPAILAVADRLGLTYTRECGDDGGCDNDPTTGPCESCGVGDAMLAVGRWNDEPDRTLNQILAVLEGTAAQLAAAS